MHCNAVAAIFHWMLRLWRWLDIVSCTKGLFTAIKCIYKINESNASWQWVSDIVHWVVRWRINVVLDSVRLSMHTMSMCIKFPSPEASCILPRTPHGIPSQIPDPMSLLESLSVRQYWCVVLHWIWRSAGVVGAHQSRRRFVGQLSPIAIWWRIMINNSFQLVTLQVSIQLIQLSSNDINCHLSTSNKESKNNEHKVAKKTCYQRTMSSDSFWSVLWSRCNILHCKL